ncbi:hypothetical protein AGMMS50212_16930 [Spirochaetia bacterium]|nr:hypothetical protein AGMMS50212_16930 [Spirochaetia bacterium]
MKKRNAFLARIFGMVLTFGLLLSGCGGGSGGGKSGSGGSGAGSTGSTTTYTGSSSEGTVEITLTPQSAKSSGIAAIDYVDIPEERSVVSGTTYSYTIKIAGVIKSSGTANVTSVTLTFTSSSGKTFSATISSGGLTSLTIKPDSGADITVASLTEAASGDDGSDDGTKIYGCTYTQKTDGTVGSTTFTTYYLSDTYTQAVSKATAYFKRNPDEGGVGSMANYPQGVALEVVDIMSLGVLDVRITYHYQAQNGGVSWHLSGY